MYEQACTRVLFVLQMTWTKKLVLFILWIWHVLYEYCLFSRYDMDETSPEESMAEAMFDEDGYTYIVLRKMIGVSRKEVVSQHSHGECPHGCSH